MAPSPIIQTVFLLALLPLYFSTSLPTAPTAHQISADVFTCDSSDPLLNAVCTVSLRKVNQELSSAGISIDRDGILFTYVNDEDRRIDTGHSCTVTAQVRRQEATARLSSASRLRLDVSSLTEPFALRLALPVAFSARIDVKQRFGFRFLGSCSNTGSDSYSLLGSLSTTADVVIGVALNPSLGTLPSGDYALVLEPQVAVLTRLRDTDLNFRVSGVSPITPILTFVTGFTSTLLRSVTALFKGDSVSRILRETLPFDLGAPILLGIGALPGFIEQAIFERLLSLGEHLAEKRAKGFGPDLEDKLQSRVNRALKVGSDGKRVIIIKRDILALLRAGNSDVTRDPPVDPSVACNARIAAACRSSDMFIIFDQCIPQRSQCQRLRREFLAANRPASAIQARPRVATTMPPTTTRPRTTTRTQAFRGSGCFASRGRRVSC